MEYAIAILFCIVAIQFWCIKILTDGVKFLMKKQKIQSEWIDTATTHLDHSHDNMVANNKDINILYRRINNMPAKNIFDLNGREN
jgi:hypothetical protein